MSSSGYYEEVINFNDLKSNEEFLKYYINEDFTDSERINYIIKKGFISQKAVLLNDLPNLNLENETLKNCICSIIENIELWDNSLLLKFSDCLGKVTQKIVEKLNNNINPNILNIQPFSNSLINIILKFFIDIIENSELEISSHYIRGFNDITDTLSEYKKIIIEPEIIEKVSIMGSFGKKNTHRKYSLFFCTCLIRVQIKLNEELYKRFMILSSDSDISIRIEFSYQIRFILESLDQSEIKKNLLKILENYINEDDIIIKSEIIISIFKNIKKISDQEFLNFYNDTINNFFEMNFPQENIIYRDKVFFSIIEALINNSITEKFYVNILKNFIKKNIVVYDKDVILSPKETQNNKNTINFEIFLNKIKEINLVFMLNNENNFMTDFTIYIIKSLHDSNNSFNGNTNNFNNQTNHGHLQIFHNNNHHNLNHSGINSTKEFIMGLNLLSPKETHFTAGNSTNLNNNLNAFNKTHNLNNTSLNICNHSSEIIENKKLFYKHLDKILEIVPKILLNKIVYPKIFGIFEINNFDNTSNTSQFSNGQTNLLCHTLTNLSNTQNNNINSQTQTNQVYIEIILNNIESILTVSNVQDNEEFFQNFLILVPKFEELVNYYLNHNNWRMLKKICYILKCKKLYKLNVSDQYIQKIFQIAKKCFNYECFEIKIESTKIIAIICRSKTYWEEIFKFIDVEILTSKNFYNRRLYLYFFDELINNFSYKMLNDKGQIEELMKLINDNTQIFIKFIRILKKIFPLVTDDKIKFLIYNKLESLRKLINNKEITDIELIETIKDFEKFNEEIKKKNSENNEIKEIFLKEKQKISEESKYYLYPIISNNLDNKKDDSLTKKIKKAKNRLSTSNSNTGTPTMSSNYHSSIGNIHSNSNSKQKINGFQNVQNFTLYSNLPLINSNKKAKRISSVSDQEKKLRRESMNNNDISRLKLSSDITSDPPQETTFIKRKDTNLSAYKPTNEYFVNQFTLTTFNTFKTNKGNINKNELLSSVNSQKDNLGFLTKNYWNSDIRNNASPTRLNKISMPSKYKTFNNSNSSKVLNKLKEK